MARVRYMFMAGLSIDTWSLPEIILKDILILSWKLKLWPSRLKKKWKIKWQDCLGGSGRLDFEIWRKLSKKFRSWLISTFRACATSVRELKIVNTYFLILIFKKTSLLFLLKSGRHGYKVVVWRVAIVGKQRAPMAKPARLWPLGASQIPWT